MRSFKNTMLDISRNTKTSSKKNGLVTMAPNGVNEILLRFLEHIFYSKSNKNKCFAFKIISHVAVEKERANANIT